MKEFAVALLAVGALLTWAYYAPRIVATARLVLERRTARRGRDQAWDSLVVSMDATDPEWVRDMRDASRRARNGNRWVAINRKRKFNYGGPVR